MTGASSSRGIQGSRNGRALIMTYVIVDAVLGLLIGAVCLSIAPAGAPAPAAAGLCRYGNKPLGPGRLPRRPASSSSAAASSEAWWRRDRTPRRAAAAGPVAGPPPGPVPGDLIARGAIASWISSLTAATRLAGVCDAKHAHVEPMPS
jgi:hypothetical protein